MISTTLFLKPPVEGSGRNVVRDFLYGCWCNGRRIGGMQMPPLNELFSATHARQDGVKTELLDAFVEPERWAGLVKAGLPGISSVAIMSSTQSFQDDLHCLRTIRETKPSIRTILFGSHPTFMPDFAINHDEVDFIIQGEPEGVIRNLLGRLKDEADVSDLPGIGYKDVSGIFHVNPPGPFLNLNDLPIPDRTLLPKGADYFNPVIKRAPYTTMLTSRGCPAKCSYCTAPAFYGNKTRVRSAELVLEELRQISRLGYREIFFRDETFSAYKGRNRTIFEGMKRENLDFTWIANARVDMIDREMMKEMKAAGCHMLKFGVESGDDAILAAYNKGATAEQAIAAFRIAHEVGIDAHAHIIFGGKGETIKTIRETVRFVKTLRPATVTFGILTPYPGTALFRDVAASHPEIMDGSASTMKNLHTSGFFSEAICGLSSDQLHHEVVRAYRHFYMRPGYILERMLRVNSFEELVISAIAGTHVLNFAISGQK